MQESNNFFFQDFVTPPAYTSEDSAFDLTDLEVLLTQYFLSVFFFTFSLFFADQLRIPDHQSPRAQAVCGLFRLVSYRFLFLLVFWHFHSLNYLSFPKIRTRLSL